MADAATRAPQCAQLSHSLLVLSAIPPPPLPPSLILIPVSANLIAKEDIVSLERGCVCCSLRSDLVEALKELERRAGASGQPFDAVLLETTGVADPGPVVSWGARQRRRDTPPPAATLKKTFLFSPFS